jgi:uncharacterized protein YjbI with pentapeptide repeats
MTTTELAAILASHKAWLRGEAEGARANLSGANLSGADLYEAYLYDANLSGAYLYGANLFDAKYDDKTIWANFRPWGP